MMRSFGWGSTMLQEHSVRSMSTAVPVAAGRREYFELSARSRLPADAQAYPYAGTHNRLYPCRQDRNAPSGTQE